MAPPDGRGRPGHSDDQKAARVKALLSNYYGEAGGDGAERDSLASMQAQRPAQHAAPETNAASAALTDLDSNEFVVDRCLLMFIDPATAKLLRLSTSNALRRHHRCLIIHHQRYIGVSGADGS